MDAEAIDTMRAAADATIANYEALCHRCRAGFWDECVADFDPEVTCPEEKPTFAQYRRAQSIIDTIEAMVGGEPKKTGRPRLAEAHGENVPLAEFEARGQMDSGYIHPDAWVFSKNIGDFADPGSTGRKAAAALYPIKPKQLCEWAYMKGGGGGVVPVMGCTGHPASDIHHGPDKNTLDNEKASRGVGVAENVWLICSFCHNAWHAANDFYYPPYDRRADQAKPWIPVFPPDFIPFTMEPASIDEIMAEEERRRREHERHGVKRAGRGGINTDRPDAGISIDELGGDGDSADDPPGGADDGQQREDAGGSAGELSD